MNLLLMSQRKDIYSVTFDGINSEGVRGGKAKGFSFTKATDLTPGADPFAKMNWMNGYDVITEWDAGSSKQKITAYEGTALFDQKIADGVGNRINIKENAWFRRMSADKIELSPKRFAGAEPLYHLGNTVLPRMGFTVHTAALDNNGLIVSRAGLPTAVNLNLLQFNALYMAQGMYAMDFNFYSALQILAQVKYANRNIQNVLGSGITSTYTGDGSTATEKAVISETNTNRIIVTNATAANFEVGDSVTLTATAFFQARITAITTYDSSNKAIVIGGQTFNTTIASTGIRRSVNWTGESNVIMGKCGSLSGADSKVTIKMLGLENFYGNAWNLLSGAFRYNSADFYIHPNNLGQTAWPVTIEEAVAEGYFKTGIALPTANGYIKSIGYDMSNRNVFLPISVGGNSAGPVGDYFYTITGNGFYISRAGGTLNNGTYGGPFYFTVHNGLAVASWNSSAFGLYKPE